MLSISEKSFIEALQGSVMDGSGRHFPLQSSSLLN